MSDFDGVLITRDRLLNGKSRKTGCGFMDKTDYANQTPDAPYIPPNPFGIKQTYWERIWRMRLLDDTLMTAALDNNIEAVQLILRIILGKDDLNVLSVHTQREYKNLYGHSVRLDVEATDSAGKLYNIEVQRDEHGAEPERARHNSALMDAHTLKTGEKANKLPETYVVFITEKDFYGRGFPVYHIDRVIAETGEMFGDRAHIVYANGAYVGEDDMGRLMADFRNRNPNEMYFSALANRVRSLKYSEKGVRDMCRAMEITFEEGRAEGRAEDVRHVMRTLGLSLEKAMDALEIPLGERRKYEEMLTRQA